MVRTVTMSQPVIPAVQSEPAAPATQTASAEPAPDTSGLALAEDLEAALNDALASDLEAALNDAIGSEPDAAPNDALAADLEAALNDAIGSDAEADTHAEEDVPSLRQQRLDRATALANNESVEHLPPLPLPPTAGSSYAAMLESYGAFPPLRPPARDFRMVLALSAFLGILGADRFYERRYLSGVLKLATCGGLGIWWIADILSILTGRARGRDGQPYRGEKKHRTIAWCLTAALFAGLIPVAVTAGTPAATAAATAINEALFPKPAPVPTWAVLAEVSGTAEPAVLDITGDRLRLTYNFPAGAYAYLQKESSTPVPAETLVLNERPTQGQTEVAVSPGRYQLVVRADGADWTLKAEERGLQG